MKNFFFAVICLLVLAFGISSSCVSSSETKIKNKKIAQAVYQEGKVYFEQKRYSTALAKFLEAEKTISDDQFLQYDIGITYMINKRYDLAEKFFKKALDIQKEFMPAMNGLGAAYLEQKKLDKAIECFKMCIDSLLYATPHYALANLGWAYLGKKDYALASDYFLKALKKVPGYPRALHGFVTVSLETNREYLALKKLDKAVKKHPDSMIIHYDYARIFEKTGQYQQARKHWEKVIDLAPDESNFMAEAESRLRK